MKGFTQQQRRGHVHFFVIEVIMLVETFFLSIHNKIL